MRKRMRWGTSVEQEVDDELAFHLEMTTRDLMAQGMTRQQARAEAERRFGDMRTVSDACRRFGTERDRRADRAEMLGELRQDLAFALRQLTRARGFTAVAIITLALGIGATAAVFSALDAVVLRPLPFDHPERIVELEPEQRGDADGPMVPEFLALRSSGVFEQIAGAVLHMGITMKLGDVPEIVSGGRVSAAYFDVFGVRPELGRTFTQEEDVAGGASVAIISHRLWVERFGKDDSVLGRTLQLGGTPHTIVGVMPASFDYTRGTEDIWVPLALAPSQATNFSERFLRAFARLHPGQSIQQARAAATTVERTVAERMPSRTDPTSAFAVRLTSFQEQVIGGSARLLFVLLGAVTFVLLIACTNVANLLLARGTTRSRELAIRAALGAGRARLIRQLLTESLVLGVAGAGAGLGIAYGFVRLIVRVGPDGIARLERTTIDWRVLAFTLALGLVSCLLFGLLPAVRAVGRRMQDALREGGRSGAGFARERVRGALVATEVALAITLLIASGLLIRSAWLMQRVDPGFDPGGVLAARLMLPAARYETAPVVTRAFRAIRDEAAAIPAVQSAALTSIPPLSGSRMSSSVVAEGQPDDDRAPTANVRIVSPGYFATMGIPVRAGRDFTFADNESAPLAVVVNEALAGRLWPNTGIRDVVGKRINGLSPDDHPRLMIVIGIVGDIYGERLTAPPQPEFYLPVDQAPPFLWPFIQRSLVVVVKSRTPAADAMTLLRPLRRAIAQVDPSLPVAEARTMNGYLERSTATMRMSMLLLSLLGGIALALAMVGIYGVVSYFVSQRTQEIGVRLALGATPARIWQFVVRRGLTPIVTGLVIGTALSTVATRALRGQLYGVSRHDPLTLAGVAVLLLLVGLLATYVPARRAMRVAPAVALVDGG